MIAFEGVGLDRGGRRVLSGLTLSLHERRIGLVGANGSGKSSFARLLNGLLLPSEGTVRVFGLDTRLETKAVRRKVGFLFQNPDNQIVYPTVGEDIAFGLKRLKLDPSEEGRRVEAALAKHGLAGARERLVHELSGGERQLVALAGVLVTEPDILVLDEPTTLLDRRNRRLIMNAVEAADRPVVMATHDLDLLDGFDRVLVFEAGNIVADGPPAEALPTYLDLCR